MSERSNIQMDHYQKDIVACHYEQEWYASSANSTGDSISNHNDQNHHSIT